ncbi:bifunctional Casein kinase II [Babesia duncani]|uniref:Casein kinase II subunit beta n=1 Tax=Babesia duncani TaxID=323732 RepID=A0AAD9PIN9_9APIC|nr:bifunctional Casein kinase II [Babesia duncani]
MNEDFEEWQDFGTDSGHALHWIQWFVGLDGNDFLLEIDESYIRDPFNLCGLRIMKNYDSAMEMILGYAPSEDIFMDGKFLDLYRSATDLYGMIHARFITSPMGLQLMKEKYLQGVFGQCPRVYCQGQNVLPVGFSDSLHNHRIKKYCPRCQEAYIFKNGEPHADLDGAYFGRSFPHIFLLSFPQLIPEDAPIPYEPKIFGFKVHNISSLIQIKLQNGEFGTSAANKERKSQINRQQLQLAVDDDRVMAVAQLLEMKSLVEHRAHFTQENVNQMYEHDANLAEKAQVAVDHNLPISHYNLEHLDRPGTQKLEPTMYRLSGGFNTGTKS